MFAVFRYAFLNSEKNDAVLNRFFGIFFLFFQFNNIVGQLISSFVLSSGNRLGKYGLYDLTILRRVAQLRNSKL